MLDKAGNLNIENKMREMVQGSSILSSILSSANKNNNNMMPMKGLKGLIHNNNHEDTEEITVNDYGLAQRKAEEAGARRYQAAEWLREMDQTALDLMPIQPTEEELCMALRNGLILCNVLNKINPRAILKVVENPVMDVQFTEGPAQSAIQYFENMRNFLMAVGNMKLLTFEASDLEKGGSSAKVVDCILCLKGYYEWKQAGGIGVWRYGGTVKITALPKESPSSSSAGSESADDSLDDFDSSLQYEQLVEYFQMSSKFSLQRSVVNMLAFLFDHFGVELLQAYLTEGNELEGLPFNSMVIDVLMRKVVKDFSSVLTSHGNQLGLFLKRIANNDGIPLSKHNFLKAILAYLDQRANLVSSDFSKFCICGGKFKDFKQSHVCPAVSSDVLDSYQKELEDLRAALRETKFTVQRFHLGWEEEQKRLVQHIQGLEGVASSYHKVMEENRMLYNQIQDLKGTIRVYCRVKPFLSGQSEEQSTVDYIGENGDIMIVNRHKQSKDARKIFSFNKVFGTNVTQEQIYGDTQPLIRSVLDGFNVCIFAYGQTGSGKTYTMSGPDLTTEETWGVNYRALNDLFNISKERRDFVEYDVGVQMIEIYNEQVRDLLILDGANKRLDIRNNSQLNGLNVPDASLIPVRCTKDVLELMKVGQRNRAVGATALNERSSRSHSILTVHVRGRELASGSTSKGCLHLVDLAGSERVLKSEAVGERLKEAQHINKSLSALGDVISALAQKSSHIPYRNSKLTQVLQDSLGGQAKTLMFVHINPEVNAIGETLSTLKFAERVASVNLGAARSNKETGEIRDLKDEISNMKSALEKKELELEQMRSGIHVRGAVSPLRAPRYNSSPSIKPDSSQRPYDDSRISEARSCSSGKQRKSRFPSKFTDKDTAPGMPSLAEERSALSFNIRSPSPPIRRSVSTERGSLVKGKSKTDAPDNLLAAKAPFLNRAPSSKTTTALHPTIPPINGGLQGYQTPFEPVKKENISDALHGLQRVTSRRVPEHEEEQFKQALNVRHGGIRKAKPENKVKIKNHISTKLQKVDEDVASVLMNDAHSTVNKDKTKNADLPDPENELGRNGSPVSFNIKTKRLHRNSSRDSQNMEPRDLQTEEFLLDKKQENKIPSKDFHNAKGTNNSSLALIRRSQSTPRGRFII